jgi:hypothetical protein
VRTAREKGGFKTGLRRADMLLRVDGREIGLPLLGGTDQP